MSIEAQDQVVDSLIAVDAVIEREIGKGARVDEQFPALLHLRTEVLSPFARALRFKGDARRCRMKFVPFSWTGGAAGDRDRDCDAGEPCGAADSLHGRSRFVLGAGMDPHDLTVLDLHQGGVRSGRDLFGALPGATKSRHREGERGGICSSTWRNVSCAAASARRRSARLGRER